jgi:hypothetical protein
MSQRNAVTVRLTPETMKALAADSETEFCSRSEIAAMRLETAYAQANAGPIQRSPEAADRARRSAIDTKLLELKLAKESNEVLSIRQVIDFLQKDYAIMRSRLLNVPQALQGATPEQVADLKKIIQDVMTDLSGDNASTWDDMNYAE